MRHWCTLHLFLLQASSARMCRWWWSLGPMMAPGRRRPSSSRRSNPRALGMLSSTVASHKFFPILTTLLSVVSFRGFAVGPSCSVLLPILAFLVFSADYPPVESPYQSDSLCLYLSLRLDPSLLVPRFLRRSGSVFLYPFCCFHSVVVCMCKCNTPQLFFVYSDLAARPRREAR